MWVDFRSNDDGARFDTIKNCFNDVSYSKDNTYHIQIYEEDFKTEEKRNLLKELARDAERIYME